jgi:hypothetical protein
MLDKVGMQYADKAPDQKRLDRYRELAKLNLTAQGVFEFVYGMPTVSDPAALNWNLEKDDNGEYLSVTTATLFSGWKKCWEVLHIEAMWKTIREAAVLDETMRWPQLALPSERNVEVKFETLMRNVQKIAVTIQEEQSGHNSYQH